MGWAVLHNKEKVIKLTELLAPFEQITNPNIGMQINIF